MATFETVVVKAVEELERLNPGRENRVSLTVQPPFYRHPLYVDALLAAAQPALEDDFGHALFSYHGVPTRHLYKTGPMDRECSELGHCCAGKSPAHTTCYRHQTRDTTLAAAKALGLELGEFSMSYQSRFGPDQWLEPETMATICWLVEQGIEDLVVFCPSFTADCLETLEEIGIRAKEVFHEAGGKRFRLVPCLNDHPLWVQALKNFCLQTPRSPELPTKVRDTVCGFNPER
jgi:ferrochelatase